METAFGYIACNACNYMLYAASRRLSLATVTALGKVTEKVTDFVFDAAVSTALIITSVRIRNKLSAVSNSKTSKASSPDDSSCKSRTSEGNGCHTNVYTTVYVNQINVTNTTNITINSADSPHKEDVRFPKQSYGNIPWAFVRGYGRRFRFICLSRFRNYESPVIRKSSFRGAFSGKRQPVESSVAFSTSTFCLSLDEGVIKELFDKMHGKYFHKRTSLEQFTYVLTGKGKKPEGVISIEWIASPRSFSLFIGIVCAPYRDKWKICKGLFTGNINKNPSCDFNRMVSHDLVKNNKVSSTLKENARFISERIMTWNPFLCFFPDSQPSETIFPFFFIRPSCPFPDKGIFCFSANYSCYF